MKNFLRNASSLIAIVATIAAIFLPVSRVAGSSRPELPQHFPRLANYYLKSPITTAEAKKLAQWDVVILGYELPYTNPEIFPILRSLNPDIILLAYVPSEEIALGVTDPNDPRAQLAQGIANEWWLRDSSGAHISNWPGTQMLNATLDAPVVNGKQWNTYLPTFVHQHVMSTGLWDGIYYDNVWQNISWINNGNIDVNGDGVAESSDAINTAWQNGMSSLLAYSRQIENAKTIIIGNGDGQYYPTMNGRLIEDFPSEDMTAWPASMRTYFDVLARGKQPPMVVINGKSTTGLSTDLRAMRFSFASTLLDDGFFSFDFGTQRHSDLWWYDEYGVDLGKPVGQKFNVRHPTDTRTQNGVWRRDFENGIVLLNSTNTSQTITLADAYEEITSTYVCTVNAGTLVTSVKLTPMDGRILLRRQFTISQGSYENGVFVRSFSADGHPLRQAFYTYDSAYPGGTEIIKADLDGDGRRETVAAIGNIVEVTGEDGSLIARFFPYGTRYHRAVTIAVGDVMSGGDKEIVTGTGNGGGPQVRIFNEHGTALSPGFFAYDKRFRGGVHVTTGDTNGDGKAEIITGAGIRGGPQVRVFTASGKVLSSFFAFTKSFRGGVDVAAGDVTGDEKAEIVVVPGPGATPRVRILDQRGKVVLPSFFAYDPSLQSGLSVSVLDMNGDLKNDILIAAPTLY